MYTQLDIFENARFHFHVMRTVVTKFVTTASTWETARLLHYTL